MKNIPLTLEELDRMTTTFGAGGTRARQRERAKQARRMALDSQQEAVLALRYFRKKGRFPDVVSRQAEKIIATVSLSASSHTKDSDCLLDFADDCCVVCGVHHGNGCPACGGRGFHRVLGCKGRRKGQKWGQR